MGKKQKQREEKKKKREERKNKALGISTASLKHKIRNQNVSIPQLSKQKKHIIEDLQKKKMKGSRGELIKSLNEKLGKTNNTQYSNLYAMAIDTTANNNLYQPSNDNYIISNIDKSNEKKLNETNKDNSRKAYMKILNEVIENADVILEVLDARDPLSCRSTGMESLIKSKNKKLILVLNKIDLIPTLNANLWKDYLRREYSTVLFKANTQNQTSHLGQSKLFEKSIKENKEFVSFELQANEAVGGDELMNIIKNYSREGNVKTKIVVGVIGYPNVGKSSVINSLKRGKVAGVSNTPGFTKGLQEIILDNDIKLLDCPGVVFSKNENNILQNTIRTEDIKEPTEIVGQIMEKLSIDYLIDVYKLDPHVLQGKEITTEKLLYLIGDKMKKYKKGGLVDLDKAARLVISDWNEGKLKYFSVPPSVDKEAFIQALEQQNNSQMKLD